MASYQVLRKAVGAFPSHTPDALGALSDFYFTASLGLDASSREEWNDYVFDLMADGRFKNPVEERRAFLLSGTNPMLLDGPDMVEEDLQRFLEVHQELHGPNPRLVS